MDKISVLELGCGKTPVKIPEDFLEEVKVVRVDISPNTNADVIHDLNEIPWPFKEDSFDVIFAHHILEHLEDIPKVMEEIYRILKSGGVVSIRYPHFRSWGAFSDPTHRHFMSTVSLNYWIEGTYRQRKYGHEAGEITFNKVYLGVTVKYPIIWRWKGFTRAISNLVSKLFVSRRPQLYEGLFYKLFPPSEVVVVLSKGKPKSRNLNLVSWVLGIKF